MIVDVRTMPEIEGLCWVWLDGRDISAHTFAADDEAGWAEVVVADEDGFMIVLDPAAGTVLTERREGQVRIVAPEYDTLVHRRLQCPRSKN